MRRAKTPHPALENARLALEAAGFPEPARFIKAAVLRARAFRHMMRDERYAYDRAHTHRTLLVGQRLAEWLTTKGVPPLPRPPTPSKGVLHSVYYDTRRPTLVLHINGDDHALPL